MNKKSAFSLITFSLVILSIVAFVAYYFTLPKQREYILTIDYTGGTALVPYQDGLYHIGQLHYFNDNQSQTFIECRRSDLVVIELLEYPETATTIEFNNLFLTDSEGWIDRVQISLVYNPSFVIPTEGFYHFDLGVLKIPFYDYLYSKGLWTFKVTIIPS